MIGFAPVLAPLLMLSTSHEPHSSLRTSRLQTSIQSLTDPDVRDLAWAALSPALFAKPAVNVLDSNEEDLLMRSQPESVVQYLRQLDADPSALRQWLDGRRRRLLGLKFEALIEFWLRNNPSELITEQMRIHTQVIDPESKRTIGEADFVIPDGTAESSFWHIETSIKYFLWVGGDLGYLGPHRKEALGNRIERANKQLTLLTAAHASLARDILNISAAETASLQPSTAAHTEEAAVGGDQVTIRPRYLSRGWLFYPSSPAVLSGRYDDVERDLRVQDGHGRGWWARELPEWEGSEDLIWTAAFRNADWPMAERVLPFADAGPFAPDQAAPRSMSDAGQYSASLESQRADRDEEGSSEPVQGKAEGGGAEADREQRAEDSPRRVRTMSASQLRDTLSAHFAQDDREPAQTAAPLPTADAAATANSTHVAKPALAGSNAAWRRNGVAPPVLVCGLVCSECGQGASCECEEGGAQRRMLLETTRGFVVGPRWEPTQLKKGKGTE